MSSTSYVETYEELHDNLYLNHYYHHCGRISYAIIISLISCKSSIFNYDLVMRD